MNLDPDVCVIMVLMNERLAAEETIERQQRLISQLTRTVVYQAGQLADLLGGAGDD